MPVKILHIGDDGPEELSVMGAGLSQGGLLSSLPEPPTPSLIAPPTMEDINADAGGDVEYDIMVPGGGMETVSSKGGEMIADPMLLAKRRLMQLKMVTALLHRQKRKAKLAEAAKGRKAKSRKKRDMQKASRKKNR